jgi:hypothetical protein
MRQVVLAILHQQALRKVMRGAMETHLLMGDWEHLVVGLAERVQMQMVQHAQEVLGRVSMGSPMQLVGKPCLELEQMEQPILAMVALVVEALLLPLAQAAPA